MLHLLKKNDNIPMWYYYADKHKGVCIEYDLGFYENNKKYNNCILLPVIYPENEEANDFRSVIYSEGNEYAMLLRNALVKHKDWNFEEEWRIIAIGDDNPVYMHLPICTIYLGIDCSEVNIRLICELREKYNMNFSIKEMVYDAGQFTSKLLDE